MRVIEQNILDVCLARLEAILAEAGVNPGQCEAPSGHDVDCVYRLPELGLSLLIEVKQSLRPYQVDGLAGRYQGWLTGPGDSRHERLLVVTRNLSLSSIEKCAAAGICVLDEEGNGFLRLPSLCYQKAIPRQRKSSSAPNSSAVFSPKASRLVRALLAHHPKAWNQTELADKTAVSESHASRMVARMVAADYVRRDKDKLRVVDPNRLLDDWAAAYRFDRHRRSRFGLAMGEYLQGLRKFRQEMQRQSIRFALTGWSAAYLNAPYGIPDSIVAYVDRLTGDIPFRALHPVESKGNVLLLLPNDEGVFQFTQPGEFGESVADVQAYLDLRSLPGRAAEQADVLREKRLAFEE